MQKLRYVTLEDIIKHYTRMGYFIVERRKEKGFEIVHLRKEYTVTYRKGKGTVERKFIRDIFIHKLIDGTIKVYKYLR